MQLAQNIQTAEVFIETKIANWQTVLAAWKADHTHPCPMPEGHIMFNRHTSGYHIGFKFFGHIYWE